MSTPTRVLYVVHGLGACGTTDLVRQLGAALDRDRFAPEVLALRADDGGAIEGSGAAAVGAERLRDHGLPAEALALPAHGGFRERIAPVARWLRARRVDVVHAQTRPGDLWATWAGLAAGVPVRIYSRQATYGGMTPGTRARYALTARAASRVVAVSDAVAEHLETVERVPRRRIAQIPDGVDFADVDAAPRRRSARAMLGLPPTAPVVACVASLVARKGHATLIDAFRGVFTERPDARLLLVGDGDERAALEAQVRAHRLGDSVRFLGWQDDPWTAVAASDVVALASLWEGLNLSLISTAALGRPIVATRLQSNAEIVEDGVSGFLPTPACTVREAATLSPAAFADAILSLLADPTRARAMGRAGKRRVRARFGADAMARRHETLYAGLLQRGGRGLRSRVW